MTGRERGKVIKQILAEDMAKPEDERMSHKERLAYMRQLPRKAKPRKYVPRGPMPKIRVQPTTNLVPPETVARIRAMGQKQPPKPSRIEKAEALEEEAKKFFLSGLAEPTISESDTWIFDTAPDDDTNTADLIGEPDTPLV